MRAMRPTTASQRLCLPIPEARYRWFRHLEAPNHGYLPPRLIRLVIFIACVIFLVFCLFIFLFFLWILFFLFRFLLLLIWFFLLLLIRTGLIFRRLWWFCSTHI